jgi:cyclohexa-1,5-dienecarbonyl-CoA hydratase
VREKIQHVERLYLADLMASHDAVEGLKAFLQKRTAQWQHR